MFLNLVTLINNMMNWFNVSLFSVVIGEASTRGQLGLMEPATPIADGITFVHHYIFYYVVVIFIAVSWVLYKLTYDFHSEILVHNRYNYVERTRILYVYLLSHLRLTHHTLLELIWTIIPGFILYLIAVPSFLLLYSIDEIIDPSLTLKVIGHQWYWSYEYSDYKVNFDNLIFDSYMVPEDELVKGAYRLLSVDNAVVLPINAHVRVIVTAADVLHCWAVPSLGIKVDAVPGRLNQGSIYLKRFGIFYGQCSEICGVNHGFMPIVVKGVRLKTYISWIINKI